MALETAFLTSGLPEDARIPTADAMSRAVRDHGAEPAFVGVIGGEPVVGIDAAGLARLSQSGRKASTRDLPLAGARGEDAGTTVAATLFLAHRAGVRVAATGGIGGVHPGEGRIDESADLLELARSPVVLVCSGAKAILDLPATLERLETLGVTVVGYGTSELPAFWWVGSGLRLPHRVEGAEEAAAVARSARELGLPGAVLVCVPPPADAALDPGEGERAIDRALADAGERGVRGAELTPYLLARVAELTEGRSLRANRALLAHNAGVAGEIAAALAAGTP
ncbi:MAG TPA: pseudouridine-5'-phosphate glycosidase [Gemmatimonadota bacterium]|nr:pseudouridine-5'-phosphate glycosidase [Gemmatimonadota bacterium]